MKKRKREHHAFVRSYMIEGLGKGFRRRMRRPRMPGKACPVFDKYMKKGKGKEGSYTWFFLVEIQKSRENT